MPHIITNCSSDMTTFQRVFFSSEWQNYFWQALFQIFNKHVIQPNNTNSRRLYGYWVWHHVTEWDMHISLLSIPSQTIFFLAFWQQDIPGSHGERSSHGAPYLAWETTPNGGRCGVVRSTQSWPNTSYNVTAVIVINIYVNQKIKSKVKFGFVTQNLHVNFLLPQSVWDS